MQKAEQAYWQAYIGARVKVDPKTGCWEWQLYRDWKGRGKANAAVRYGHDQQAHRLSYTAFKGPIPKGRGVRHKCHNPPCCNPAHLLPGTQQDNIDDNRRAGRKIAQQVLTVAKVARIRRLLAKGVHTQAALGKRFGVDPSTISRVAHGRTWRVEVPNSKMA